MIILEEDWAFTVSKEDCCIGYAGENQIHMLCIQKMGTDYTDWNFVLDVQQGYERNIWAVEKRIEDGKLLLAVPIKREYIARSGNVIVQLRATAPNGRVKKSAQLSLSVSSSINAPDVLPEVLPSEFEEYELRILDARTATENAADTAKISAKECASILEEVKDYNTWQEFGQTPCKLSVSKLDKVKLKAPSGSCAYHVYSDTIKDMDSQERKYYGGITEDASKGYYEFTLTTAATAWYNVYVRMIFTGLEVSKTYKIYVDTTGLQPGSTTATMLYGQFLLAASNGGAKGDTILAPTRISSAGLHGYNFVPTTADVMLEYYPGNVAAELVKGYQWRINDIYVNRDGAEDAHTPIYDKQGTFSGEVILADAVSGLHYEAVPPCAVWYSQVERYIQTIDGVAADEDGNIVLPKNPVSRLEGKTLVCFGDSITGMFAAPTDYPSVIAKLTGMTVYNVGMEGCRMSRHPDQYYDAFCMYRLAGAVTSGDYSLQEAAVGHTASYAAMRVRTLKIIDWAKVDYVTIFYGTNDIQGGVSLDNTNTPKDTTTYLGAARYALETLWGAYPHLKILLLTPIYRYWNDADIDSDEKLFGSRHFYAFGDALIEFAQDYKTPAVDLYRTLGFNKFTRGYYFPASDGTHPNELGRELIGSKIAAKLLSEF